MSQTILSAASVYLKPALFTMLPIAADTLTTYCFSKSFKRLDPLPLSLGALSCVAVVFFSPHKNVKIAAPLLYLSYKAAVYIWSYFSPSQPVKAPTWSHEQMTPVVETLITKIEKNITEENLYQRAGNVAHKNRQFLAWSEDSTAEIIDTDIYTLCSLLKSVVGSSPLLQPQLEAFKQTDQSLSHAKKSALIHILQSLSPPTQQLFRIMIKHLAKISTHQTQNKMSSAALASTFVMVFFGSSDPKGALTTLSLSSLITFIIDNHEDIFSA